MLCLYFNLFLAFIDYNIFFFNQKPPYEMRISDWSSDVCSSDLFTNVSEKAVISVMDLDNIHKIPMWLHAQGLDQVVAERLRLDDRAAESADLSEWLAVVEAAEYPIDEVTIGIVGKY